MSKERARRRAERERIAALKTAARAQELERRERRLALKKALTGPFNTRSGRPTGILAERRAARRRVLACVLVFLNVVVWIARSDAAARFGALLVTLIALPVLLALTS